MAKKTVAAKKRNVKVDANGQLHVRSFLGLQQVKWVSGVLKRILLMQLKWQRRIVRKLHMTLA